VRDQCFIYLYNSIGVILILSRRGDAESENCRPAN